MPSCTSSTLLWLTLRNKSLSSSTGIAELSFAVVYKFSDPVNLHCRNLPGGHRNAPHAIRRHSDHYCYYHDECCFAGFCMLFSFVSLQVQRQTALRSLHVPACATTLASSLCWCKASKHLLGETSPWTMPTTQLYNSSGDMFVTTGLRLQNTTSHSCEP